jgi:hypothetical protein
MFTIDYVKDLTWNNAEHTSFSCLVKYEEFNEEHPTGVNATDTYAHIKELWTKGNAGEYGTIAEYVPPPIPEIPVVDPSEQPPTTGTQNA